jgi:hypothetical protein
MADTVTSQTIFSGPNKAIFGFTNVSDGTGESAVKKIDISTLTGNPSYVRVNRIWYNTFGMAVKIIYDHTADDTVLVLQGDGQFDFNRFGGIPDPASGGDTGDILFTTVGHTAGDTYSIVMEVVW